MTNEQIRDIFMAHGFTIKEGQTDLKPYVYDAARALLASKPAVPEGWRLVPEKVTNAMIDAANDTPSGIAGTPPHWQWVWDAMLAAAPAHAADHTQCCDSPAFCSSVRRCTAKDPTAAPAQSCGDAEQADEAVTDAASDLAFSVFSGIDALRWLLNITTEFDRKDVRTRQAARLLDDYTDSFGKTNRQRLEDLWKKLNDKLPDDGRINEYLRAHDSASRELKARAKDSK
jgi:hypothetical protein